LKAHADLCADLKVASNEHVMCFVHPGSTILSPLPLVLFVA
jgi:hypothetical protein